MSYNLFNNKKEMEKITNKELYNEMLEFNSFGNWINPKFQQIKNPEFPDHFMIKMEKFKSIQSTYRTEIYSIMICDNETVVHCKCKNLFMSGTGINNKF